MPETPPSVDGITPTAETPPTSPEAALPVLETPVAPPLNPAALQAKKRMKSMVLMLLGIPYVAFMGWCAFLLSILPDPKGEKQNLVQLGSLTSMIGGGLLLLIGAFALMRVMAVDKATRKVRLQGVLRVLGVFLPGLILSAVTPFMISREPPLMVDIVDPTEAEDVVAPLAITFSAQNAVAILEKRGLRAVAFSWDFNGDGKKDEDTAEPLATAVFDRQGAYNTTVAVTLSDRSIRRITRSFFIPKAVFSVDPAKPMVDEPVQFSLAHLFAKPEDLREAQWDFDGDGKVDEVTNQMSVVNTYLRTGPVKVSVTVVGSNQVQTKYERTVNVSDPEPPPFPVKIISEPVLLVSPAPFGTIFRIETETPIRDVVWDFGDGDQATGERVGHTFRTNGKYLVSAQVRAQDGPIAKLSTVVRVVPSFSLPDLAFDGEPRVAGNRIEAEVPVTIDLTPRTNAPLIQFSWEAPKATVVGSTDSRLQAIYRTPGTYLITLIGQDPDGRVLRQTITLEAKPPSSNVTFRMNPEGGYAPLLVKFDASETNIPGEEITGFEWIFGDKGTNPQQRGAKVEYLFEKPGTFEVMLSAYTTTGQSFQTRRTIVVRAQVLDACFLPSRTTGPAPLGVSFDLSCTTGTPSTILWDFGDGTQSDEAGPIHVFQDPGTYDVTLSIKDTTGSVSTKTISIIAK